MPQLVKVAIDLPGTKTAKIIGGILQGNNHLLRAFC